MLLDNIIDRLTDKDCDLVDVLLKTKRLLHEIGKKELSEWVNHEINGYPKHRNVPAYRIVRAQVKGDIESLVRILYAYPIPIGHLSDEQRKKLEKIPMREALAVIEELSTKETLQRPIPMEANGVLGKRLAEGNCLMCAWCDVAPPQLKGILTQVRSRLLDFVLELRDLVPEAASEEELKQKVNSADITGMFNNAVFGPGTNIVIGDNNRQTVVRDVKQGDFGSLAAALTALQVPLSDIRSLEEALDNRTTDREGVVIRWLKSLKDSTTNCVATTGAGVVKDAVTKAVLDYLGLS